MSKKVKVALQKNLMTGRYDCVKYTTNEIITYLTSGERFNLIDGSQVISGRIEHGGHDYYWVSDSGGLKKELHDNVVGFI